MGKTDDPPESREDPQGSLRVCQMTLLMTLRDDQSVSDDPVGCSLHVELSLLMFLDDPRG